MGKIFSLKICMLDKIYNVKTNCMKLPGPPRGGAGGEITPKAPRNFLLGPSQIFPRKELITEIWYEKLR